MYDNYLLCSVLTVFLIHLDSDRAWIYEFSFVGCDLFSFILLLCVGRRSKDRENENAFFVLVSVRELKLKARSLLEDLKFYDKVAQSKGKSVREEEEVEPFYESCYFPITFLCLSLSNRKHFCVLGGLFAL